MRVSGPLLISTPRSRIHGPNWPPAPVIGAGTARWSVRRVRRSYADLPQLLLQPDRVVMVFAQPRDVMFQSVKTGRRQMPA